MLLPCQASVPQNEECCNHYSDVHQNAPGHCSPHKTEGGEGGGKEEGCCSAHPVSLSWLHPAPALPEGAAWLCGDPGSLEGGAGQAEVWEAAVGGGCGWGAVLGCEEGEGGGGEGGGVEVGCCCHSAALPCLEEGHRTAPGQFICVHVYYMYM